MPARPRALRAGERGPKTRRLPAAASSGLHAHPHPLPQPPALTGAPLTALERRNIMSYNRIAVLADLRTQLVNGTGATKTCQPFQGFPLSESGSTIEKIFMGTSPFSRATAKTS